MTRIVITGANRGIGLEHVKLWLENGAEVHAACRAPAEAHDLKSLDPGDGRLTLHAYDAADRGAGRRLAEAVGMPVDILFANAGIFGPREGQALGRTDPDSWEEVLRVNALGPLLLAEAFCDLVAASDQKKIVLQSSRMGSMGDNSSGGYYTYRPSKAALNAIGRSLAMDLRDRGISVVVLHPGWVKTDMGGESAPLTPQQSAAGEKAVIDALNLANSGQFHDQSGDEISW
tara:strand:+ start:6329 stop:7021 length:693 start_codon:yes stop_codon:yes gene_type:complete